MTMPNKALLEDAIGSVSRETFERLVALEVLFRKWAGRINLVAPSTLPDLWHRHIIDSAQLVKYAPTELRWLDIGSGGGFPGLVLGVLLRARSDASIELVESNQKKVSFLRVAAAQLELPVTVHAIRIEQAAATISPHEIVTARALAPLAELLDLAFPFFDGHTRGLFHKGRDYRRELEESSDDWGFDLLEHPSVVEPDSVILDISNVRRHSA